MSEQSASIYTNIQGLNSIKQKVKDNPELAKKEVAKQFESLMLQIMLKSMREGTRAISEENDEGEHKEFYEDLFDNQLSLSLSDSGFGLAELIEKSIDKAEGVKIPSEDNISEQQMLAIDGLKRPELKPHEGESGHGFIHSLMSLAKGAAKVLGADPKILLAQAALETNWGKSIISHLTGKSSHNLFNIKADKSWKSETVSADSTEYSGNQSSKTASEFRAYQSFAESFKDYVTFLQNNPRYHEALKQVGDPEKFIQQLQKANFATDPNYAHKVMQIYRSLA